MKKLFSLKRAGILVVALFAALVLSRPLTVEAKAGWVEKGGKRYFAKEDGSYYKNQVITFGGVKAYYMGADGSAQPAVAKWGNELRYFDGKGNVKKDAGWVNLNGKKYFANTNGYLYHDQVIGFGGKKFFYMGKDGSVQTGPGYWNGKLRFFDGKGGVKKTSGWINHNGKRYFADANGYLYHDQMITFGSKIAYYMGSDGAVQQSTVSKYNGHLRYFDKNGKIKQNSGWVNHNGKSYFAAANGVLYSNQLITFGSTKAYYMGKDGSAQKDAVVEVNGVLRYFDKNGNMKRNSGWITCKGKKYYADANGILCRDQVLTFGGGKQYFMGHDGSVQEKKSGELIVVIDPGHGGTDPGAGGYGLREADLTHKIANNIAAELRTYKGVKVYLTRQSRDESLKGQISNDLVSRVESAKSMGADLFFSVHINAGGASGAEVLIQSANYRSDLHSQSKALAQKVKVELAALGMGIRNDVVRHSTNGSRYPDGSLQDYYSVIRNSKLQGIPAVLVEHGFIDSYTDVYGFLNTDAKLKNLGVADATAIAKHYGLKKG